MAATECKDDARDLVANNEPLIEEPSDNKETADDDEVDVADHFARANAMFRSVNMARTVTGISPSRLIATSKRTTEGKGLADGGADTIVCGVGWTQQSTASRTATIKGFSDDSTKTEIPTGTAATAAAANGHQRTSG